MMITAEGKITITATDGKYCARKSLDDSTVTIDEDVESCILSSLPGSIIYLDVTNGTKCTNYYEDNSISEYNGLERTRTTENQTSCLKFYTLSREGDRLNLILDHNTSDFAAYSMYYSYLDAGTSSSSYYTINPEEMFKSFTRYDSLWTLDKDTKEWTWSETPTTYYDEYSGYTINYEALGLNTRLITRDEILSYLPYYNKNKGMFYEGYYSTITLAQSKLMTDLDYLNSINYSDYIDPETGVYNYNKLLRTYMLDKYNDLFLSDFLYDNLPKYEEVGYYPSVGGYWSASSGMGGINYVNYTGGIYQVVSVIYTDQIPLEELTETLEIYRNILNNQLDQKTIDWLQQQIIQTANYIQTINTTIETLKASITDGMTDYEREEIEEYIAEYNEMLVYMEYTASQLNNMLKGNLTEEDILALEYAIYELELELEDYIPCTEGLCGEYYSSVTFPIGIRPVVTIKTSKLG